MNTAKQIAMWVIDNRYPNENNESVSDVEMYNTLVANIEKLINATTGLNCIKCKQLTGYLDPCLACSDFLNKKLEIKS